MTQPLGNIDQQPEVQAQMTVAPSHQLFDKPAQNQLYYDQVTRVRVLEAEKKSLAKMIEQAREEISRLVNEKLTDKQGYELNLRDQIATQKEEYQTRIDDLREQLRQKDREIENLNRDINEAKNGSTLNGIVTKAMDTPGGMQELLAGGANIINALSGLVHKNGALPAAQAPASTPQLQAINQVLSQGSPEDQQAILELVQAIILKAQSEAQSSGAPFDVKPIIQTIITEINVTA